MLLTDAVTSGKSALLLWAVLFENTKVPVQMSITSTEAVCCKLIFTKFACSVKGVPSQEKHWSCVDTYCHNMMDTFVLPNETNLLQSHYISSES